LEKNPVAGFRLTAVSTGWVKYWRPSPPQILVTGFAAVILVGAVLLTLPFSLQPGKTPDFLTSLFTATSAVCVTGLVVVDTGTHWSTAGQVIILLLIQVGGLGFMSMATFFSILMGRRINLRERLLIKEALNQLNIEGIVRLAKYVFVFTFGTELIFALILGLRWSADMGFRRGMWYGLFHSVSAFNNAGFDIFGGFKSLTEYKEDVVVIMSITTLIILGGIGFSVIADIYRSRKGLKRLSLHSKLVLTITTILLAAGAILILLLEWSNTLAELNPAGKLLASYFQSVTPRTAGYNTLDIAALHGSTQFLLIVLMFIGASPGSTGGGIKTSTFGALSLAVLSQVAGKDDAEVFGRRIPKWQIYKSLAIAFMALALVMFMAFLLEITENASFLKVLFETVSAFGTVGLTMGLTPELTSAGRILIILTMFAGRLGPLTVALAMAKRRKRAVFRFPEENIIVG